MFEAYNTTSTTYTTNQPINFSTIRYEDCRVQLRNNNTIVINTPGRYYVSFHGVGASDTANGQFTVQLYNNGVAVPGITTTISTNAATEPETLAASTIVNVLPSCAAVCNNASLQFVATSTDAGTLTSTNVVIFRLK